MLLQRSVYSPRPLRLEYAPNVFPHMDGHSPALYKHFNPEAFGVQIENTKVTLRVDKT